VSRVRARVVFVACRLRAVASWRGARRGGSTSAAWAVVVSTVLTERSAASGAGDTAAARKAFGELKANWHAADPGLPELTELKRLIERASQ